MYDILKRDGEIQIEPWDIIVNFGRESSPRIENNQYLKNFLFFINFPMSMLKIESGLFNEELFMNALKEVLRFAFIHVRLIT